MQETNLRNLAETDAFRFFDEGNTLASNILLSADGCAAGCAGVQASGRTMRDSSDNSLAVSFAADIPTNQTICLVACVFLLLALPIADLKRLFTR